MPAGDTSIYYGIRVPIEKLWQILNMDCNDDIDDSDDFFADNKEELSIVLKKNKFKGELKYIICDEDDNMVIYGYHMVEYYVFDHGEFDFDAYDYKIDLIEFKTKYDIESNPKFYCCYVGD